MKNSKRQRPPDIDRGEASPITRRLEQLLEPGEVVSPIVPERLGIGTWWQRRGRSRWPAALAAGVIEPRRGYRFRPENVALVGLLEEGPVERVVDLGSGSGSLLLIAAVMLTPHKLLGLDVQAESIERLERTLKAHQIEGAETLVGDLRTAEVLHEVARRLEGPADLVLMNPPYFPGGWGRASRQESTRLSTHAHSGDVRDFLRAATWLLAPTGRIRAVFDASRLSELLAAAGDLDLCLESLVWIPDQRPGKQDHPFRVWVALTPAGAGRPGARVERLE